MKYGPLFVIFHGSCSLICTAVAYVLITRGFDTTPFISFAENFVNLDNILAKVGHDRSSLTGTPTSKLACFGVAVIMNKCIQPLRLAFSCLMVPLIAKTRDKSY
ncbi:hypothetical protein ACHWQZ_G000300 [Mnemiopsis leidyi]